MNSIELKKWLRIVKASCAIMRKECMEQLDYVCVPKVLYTELEEAVKDLDNDGSERDRPGQGVETKNRPNRAETEGP